MTRENGKKNVRMEKFILEARYPAVIQVFDRRGGILEKVWQPFSSKMPFWKVENAQVSMVDSEGPAKRVATVSHMRASLSYEQPGTEQEFFDDSVKFLKSLYSVLPEIKSVDRLGFRYIKYEGSSEKSVVDYFMPIRKKWLAPQIPTSLPINDLAIIMEHESGRVSFGSNKAQDNFLSNVFTSWIGDDVPGYHLDIDTKVSSIEVNSDTSLVRTFSSLKDVMISVRDEVSRAII